MLYRVLALMSFAGCGFRTSSAGSDAFDAPDDTPHDVARDGQPADCFAQWLNHSLSFSSTALDVINQSASFERDPFLTKDLLTLYFASDRVSPGNGGDIFASTRTDPTRAFGTPVPVADMTSTSDDSKVSITDDGQIAILASDRTIPNGQGSLDAWFATSTGVGAFGAFTQMHMGAVNDNGPQFDPEITADGLHLYLAPSFGGTQKIALATRADRASDFSQPTALLVVNSGEGDADPTVSPDERVIVFSSRRSGGAGGSTDLYYATRASPGVAFDPPFKLGALNTNDDENDPMLSHDGCHLVFSRHVGGTNWDLFEADLAP